MGSSVSTVDQIQREQQSGDQRSPPAQTLDAGNLVKLLMPLYYTTEPITAEEKEAVSYVWKLIVRNQCAHFNAYKAAHPEKGLKLVTEFLHILFYERLFLIHPSCRELFQRSISKMNMVPMISLCLSKFEEPDKLQKSLANLVSVHNNLGVKAVEYGMVGEVLMYAIKECVGPKEYSPAAHHGWCKIYSAMLDTIIPEVVKYEIESTSQARETNNRRGLMALNSLQSFEGVVTSSLRASTSSGAIDPVHPINSINPAHEISQRTIPSNGALIEPST